LGLPIATLRQIPIGLASTIHGFAPFRGKCRIAAAESFALIASGLPLSLLSFALYAFESIVGFARHSSPANLVNQVG
jgi:hypothetical protein